MGDRSSLSSRFLRLLPIGAVLGLAFFIGTAFVITDYKQGLSRLRRSRFIAVTRSTSCMQQCVPLGSEALPRGIVNVKSNLEMQPLWGDPINQMEASRSLLAIAAGIRQKATVDRIVKKFSLDNFTIMLFHYDGVVDEWKDLYWSDSVVHVSAINQTKWWFAKRFLHPDIVSEYNYIFLWDEDLDVENFHPIRYLSIVKEEGLEISQPALDPEYSEVHHRITVRGRASKMHRRIYKSRGSWRCYKNSTSPPCAGWVEVMAPVFSKAAWRCVWHMIQNDLIHAWGLDFRIGYCAQGNRIKNVGVVDAEYIVHKGIPSLGGAYKKQGIAEAPAYTSHLAKSSRNKRPQVAPGHSIPYAKSQATTEAPGYSSHLVKSSRDNSRVAPGPSPPDDRSQIRFRSSTEWEIFKQRWEKAAAEDACWIDPYPSSNSRT